MTRSKRLNMLIALIIAFGAWVYVIYNVDPATTRVYREVPIQFTHEDSLRADGLAIRSVDFETVDITVQAKRSVLAELTPDNIVVYADLESAGKGENTLDIEVTPPNNTQIMSQSEQRVLIEVEDQVSESKPARVEYADPSATTMEPFVTEQSTDAFTVYGAETLVNDVAYVRIPVTNEKVTDSVKTFSVEPVAVDNAGNLVSFVRIEPDKASAAVYNAETKEVTLKASVSNPDNDSYHRTYDAPETITIRGTKEALEEVTSITTEMIDLSSIDESKNIPMTYDLPEGVQIANVSADATMFVKVTPYVTKEITIPAEQIKVQHLTSGFKATVEEDSVMVLAVGTSEQVEALTEADFTVTVDLRDLEAGRYDVKAEVSTSAKLFRTELEQTAVTVDITE